MAPDPVDQADFSRRADNRADNVHRVGLLSQTLAPSSHIRFILPARIRSRHHRDVVFISGNSIQLFEALPNAELASVTAKVSLSVRVMAAKVISAEVTRIPSFDSIIQKEYDEEHFTINGQPVADDHPTDIVVLCTADGELLYAYARSISNNGVRLVLAKRNILHRAARASKFGRHMAVEHKSRLLAVASADTCVLISLKNVGDIKSSIDSWDPQMPKSFQPSREQRFLSVDGTIARMEFLPAPEEERTKVYLLCLVVRASQTHIVLYQWDTRHPLTSVEAVGSSGYTLPAEESFPVLLIPAARSLSFWLVTRLELVYYENLKAGVEDIKRINVPLPQHSLSKEGFLWTQWIRAWRHDKHMATMDDFLMIREDGMVVGISRRWHPASNVIQSTPAGHLGMSIDKAVCTVRPPLDWGGDLIIAGGVGCDVGFFHLPPKENLRLIQSLPNISPLHGMVVTNTGQRIDRDARPSVKTVVLSESTDGVSLNRIQFGLESQVGWTLPVEQCGTIDRLWALDVPATESLFYIGSQPDHTVVIQAVVNSPADLIELQPENSRGFDLEHSTLAAAALSNGAIVQVTPIGINVVFDRDDTMSSFTPFPAGQCVCADIGSTDGAFIVATALSDNSYALTVGFLDVSSGTVQVLTPASSQQVASRPQVTRLTRCSDHCLLVVGYFDGSVQFFSVDQKGSIHYQTELAGSGVGGCSVSDLIILGEYGGSDLLLLVGTNDGLLKVVDVQCNIQYDGLVIAHELLTTYTLNISSVLFAACDTTDHAVTSALVSCGSKVGRLRYLSNGTRLDHVFENVWITARQQKSFEQPAINAIHRIRHTGSYKQTDTNGLVMYATEEEILFASLLEQEQTIPQYLADYNGARHVQYSKFLQRYVIAADGHQGKGRSAMIHLFDPKEPHKSDKRSVSLVCGEPQEKIQGLMIWSPSDGHQHYEFILVALGDGTNSRVVRLPTKKLVDGASQTTGRSMLRFVGRDIHALCPFNLSSAVISAGNQLILLHLDMGSKKFRQLSSNTMPSPALSLAARGSHVYAATANHSMVVLHIRGDTFERVFTDTVARNARDVVPFGIRSRNVLVTTVSNNGTSVSGYIEGGSVGDSPSPSFVASVPLPLNCLFLVPSIGGTNATPDDDHHTFQGSTLDGTIYSFKTLTYDEWKLVSFLEKLVQCDFDKPIRHKSLMSPRLRDLWRDVVLTNGDSSIRDPSRDSSNTVSAATLDNFDPTIMHVNGDILARLIEEGPYDLQRLLFGLATANAEQGPTEIKTEDGVGDDDEDKMILATDDDDTSTQFKIQNQALARLEVLARPVLGSERGDVVSAVVAWVRKLLRSSIGNVMAD